MGIGIDLLIEFGLFENYICIFFFELVNDFVKDKLKMLKK